MTVNGIEWQNARGAWDFVVNGRRPNHNWRRRYPKRQAARNMAGSWNHLIGSLGMGVVAEEPGAADFMAEHYRRMNDGVTFHAGGEPFGNYSAHCPAHGAIAALSVGRGHPLRGEVARYLARERHLMSLFSRGGHPDIPGCPRVCIPGFREVSARGAIRQVDTSMVYGVLSGRRFPVRAPRGRNDDGSPRESSSGQYLVWALQHIQDEVLELVDSSPETPEEMLGRLTFRSTLVVLEYPSGDVVGYWEDGNRNGNNPPSWLAGWIEGEPVVIDVLAGQRGGVPVGSVVVRDGVVTVTAGKESQVVRLPAGEPSRVIRMGRKPAEEMVSLPPSAPGGQGPEGAGWRRVAVSEIRKHRLLLEQGEGWRIPVAGWLRDLEG